MRKNQMMAAVLAASIGFGSMGAMMPDCFAVSVAVERGAHDGTFAGERAGQQAEAQEQGEPANRPSAPAAQSSNERNADREQADRQPAGQEPAQPSESEMTPEEYYRLHPNLRPVMPDGTVIGEAENTAPPPAGTDAESRQNVPQNPIAMPKPMTEKQIAAQLARQDAARKKALLPYLSKSIDVVVTGESQEGNEYLAKLIEAQAKDDGFTDLTITAEKAMAEKAAQVIMAADGLDRSALQQQGLHGDYIVLARLVRMVDGEVLPENNGQRTLRATIFASIYDAASGRLLYRDYITSRSMQENQAEALQEIVDSDFEQLLANAGTKAEQQDSNAINKR